MVVHKFDSHISGMSQT